MVHGSAGRGWDLQLIEMSKKLSGILGMLIGDDGPSPHAHSFLPHSYGMHHCTVDQNKPFHLHSFLNQVFVIP